MMLIIAPFASEASNKEAKKSPKVSERHFFQGNLCGWHLNLKKLGDPNFLLHS